MLLFLSTVPWHDDPEHHAINASFTFESSQGPPAEVVDDVAVLFALGPLGSERYSSWGVSSAAPVVHPVSVRPRIIPKPFFLVSAGWLGHHFRIDECRFFSTVISSRPRPQFHERPRSHTGLVMATVGSSLSPRGSAVYRYDRQTLLSVTREGFVRTRRVRFQDVDAAGVIFYAAVFEYCHDLYVEYLEAHGVSLVDVLKQRQWAAPIRHAEADYLRPLRFGDEIAVSLPVAHLADSELTLGYRISFGTSREVAVVAQSVHTFVSLPDFKRCPVPEGVFMAFQPLV